MEGVRAYNAQRVGNGRRALIEQLLFLNRARSGLRAMEGGTAAAPQGSKLRISGTSRLRHDQRTAKLPSRYSLGLDRTARKPDCAREGKRETDAGSGYSDGHGGGVPEALCGLTVSGQSE